jgi:hypothetical protein
MKKITKILLTVSVSILIVSFSKVVTSDSSEIENKAQKKIDERSKIPEELIQGNWDFESVKVNVNGIISENNFCDLWTFTFTKTKFSEVHDCFEEKYKTEGAYQIKKDTLDMGPTKYIIKELNEEVLVLIQTEIDIPYESTLNFKRMK